VVGAFRAEGFSVQEADIGTVQLGRFYALVIAASVRGMLSDADVPAPPPNMCAATRKWVLIRDHGRHPHSLPPARECRGVAELELVRTGQSGHLCGHGAVTLR